MLDEASIAKLPESPQGVPLETTRAFGWLVRSLLDFVLGSGEVGQVLCGRRHSMGLIEVQPEGPKPSEYVMKRPKALSRLDNLGSYL
jgi:hypothetical protein